MATKEKAPTSAERVKALSERNATEAAKASKTLRAERQAVRDIAESNRQEFINAERRVKPDPEGDIDQRMAALLKDHKEMGAR